MATKIQLRHDSSERWTQINPILLAGEVGIELDTKKFKIGDGQTTWNELTYAIAGTDAKDAVDNVTIVVNDDGTISATGLVDQNEGTSRTWTGTLREYETLTEKSEDTLYYIVDDESIIADVEYDEDTQTLVLVNSLGCPDSTEYITRQEFESSLGAIDALLDEILGES